MRTFLAPHVRACFTPSGGVLLDLEHNRYLGLPELQARDLEARLRSSTDDEGATPAWLEALGRRGLLAAEQHSVLPSRGLDPATVFACIADGARPTCTATASTLVRFVHACAWARLSLRRRSLYAIAQQVAGWHVEPHPTRSLHDCVSHFRRLRPWFFAAKHHCLFHALALRHFLHAHGHHAYWIIGITTEPWAAHSWIQTDTHVLDGTPEHVRLYSPILVI